MVEWSLRKFAAPALLVGLAALGACTYWSKDFDRLVDQSSRDFERDPDPGFRDVDFGKIIRNPSAYMLMEVRFWALLNRKDEGVFVPMYSTFRQEDYLAFSLWPLDARVWEERERTHSIPTIYIHKNNPDLQKVIDAPRYSVVQIRGRVMGDYDSGDEVWGRLPFIDARYFSVAIGGPEYDDEAIKFLAAGLDDASQRRSAPAKEKLSKAIQGTLGLNALAIALSRLGLIHEEAGQFDAAVEHYQMALSADPANAEAAQGLARTQKALERKRAIEEGAPK